MTRRTPLLSRRTALRTAVGTALVSLSGCVGSIGRSEPDTSKNQSDSPDILESVAVDGTSVVVELTSGTDIDQMNLIQPNGKILRQKEITAGLQQISFEIGTTYAPGKYEILGLKGEKTVLETSLDVDPTLKILDMGIGRNQPEKMWDGEKDVISEEAFVTVENRGSGPDSITKLLFIGDVPYPSDEDGTNYVENQNISGIYDPDTASEVDEVIINSGEQVTLYSSRSPFAFIPGAGTSCTEEEQTGEFKLILETRVGNNRVSATYNIQYSAAGTESQCRITINKK